MVLKTGCVNDRLKDMIFPKKDHENCNRTGEKKTMYFIMKTLLIKKQKKTIIESSLRVGGIAHRT